MKIKFVDLAAQNREIHDRVVREFAEIHERYRVCWRARRWRRSRPNSPPFWGRAA